MDFTPTGILMGKLCGSPMGSMGTPHGAHVGPMGEEPHGALGAQGRRGFPPRPNLADQRA